MTFGTEYTDEQRDACTSAALDRGVTPHTRILELAAAGELKGTDGQRLEPFEVVLSTFRTWLRRERNRRVGRVKSTLLDAAPRDAIETLRQRLIAAADKLLADFEKKVARDPAKSDPERLRQLVRVVREAAALPGPNDARPVAPGAQSGGKRPDRATTSGIGGAILRDAAGEAPLEPAPVEPEPVPHNQVPYSQVPDPAAADPASPADAVLELARARGMLS